MKRIVFLIVTVILLSCSVDHETERILSHVSELIEKEQPDSAMILLDCIKVKKTALAKKYQMRYELLRVRAMIKQHIPIDTIAVVEDLYNYYHFSNNRNDKMMVYFLKGCAYRDKGDIPNALKYYRDAVNAVDTTEANCDFKNLSRIYGQIAYLFSLQHTPQYELDAEWKAVKMAWKAKDTLAAIRFHEFLASAYYTKGEKDSAILVSNQVSILYKQLCNRQDMAIRSQSTAIQIYLERKEFEKALSLLVDFEKYSGLFDKKGNIASGYELFYYLKGQYYEGTNRFDSARYYYMILLQYQDDINKLEAAYKGLSSIYTHIGQSDSMAKYATLYCEVNDSSNLRSSSEEIIRMQSLYDYTENQRIAIIKAKEAERLKTSLYLIALVAVVFTYLIYIYIKRQQRKSMSEIVSANAKYSEILSQYNKSQEEMTSLKSGYDHYQTEKQQEIEKLQQLLAVYQEDKTSPEQWDIEHALLNSKIVCHLHQLASKAKFATNAELEDLRKIVFEHLPDFYHRITFVDTNLTDKEIIVSILCRLRFIPSEMTVLLGLTPQRITNIRSNINMKLFHEKSAQSLESNLRRF